MQQRNIIIVGIAILVGLAAVFLANSYFSDVEQEQARVAEEQRLTRIAVAAQPLEFGSALTSESVRLVNWPASSVPQGAITDINRFQGSDVAIRPIAQGEPILISRISERAVLSENIPEGMRAATIPINDVNGVAGFVTPGDVVDVLLTRSIDGNSNSSQRINSVVMENVQVLAIDKRSSENSTEPQSLEMVTVLTDQKGAQTLALATRVGSLSLALRNVENQDIGGTEVVTMADIPGGLRRAAPQRSGAPARAAPAPRRASSNSGVRSDTGRPLRSEPSGPTMLIYRGTDGERREVPRG